jgi:hypothetical protein
MRNSYILGSYYTFKVQLMRWILTYSTIHAPFILNIIFLVGFELSDFTLQNFLPNN